MIDQYESISITNTLVSLLQRKMIAIAIFLIMVKLQLNWVVLHGGVHLSQPQHQAVAGALQAQWRQLEDQQKKVVSNFHRT